MLPHLARPHLTEVQPPLGVATVETTLLVREHSARKQSFQKEPQKQGRGPDTGPSSLQGAPTFSMGFELTSYDLITSPAIKLSTQ